MQVEEDIRTIITPLLEKLSVNLWDVEWNGSRLRILVDKPQGIDTEALDLVSRVLSSELDAADPLPSRYTLEVSSPGLERTLRHTEHFHSSIGKKIKLKLNTPIENQTLILGKLLDASESELLVETQQENQSIPTSAIKKANIVFEWEDVKDSQLVGDF